MENEGNNTGGKGALGVEMNTQPRGAGAGIVFEPKYKTPGVG